MEVLAVIDHPIARSQVGPQLDGPIKHGLAIERGASVEIRHALIGEAIRDNLGPVARRHAHELAARLVSDQVEAARHLAAANLPEEARQVAFNALEAATDPLERAALLALIAENADPEMGIAPRLQAAAALSAVADWNGVVRVLRAAGGQVSVDENAERDTLLAHACFSIGRHDDARTLLEAAASYPVDPGSATAADVSVERAAFMVNVDGQLMPAIRFLEGELTHHPVTSPSHHGIRAILESMRMLAIQPVDIGYLTAAATAAFDGGDYASAADLARVVSFATLIWRGVDPALDYQQWMGSRFVEANAPGPAMHIQAESVQTYILAGRPADAVAWADDLLEQPAPPRARQTAAIFRGRALGLLGRLDEARDALAAVAPSVTPDFVGRGELLATQAELAFWGGLDDVAIELAGTIEQIPSPIYGAYTLSQITRAWAQFDAGVRPVRPARIIEAPTMAGAPVEMDGLQLRHEGRPAEAAERFAEATRLWAGFNEPRAMFSRWAEAEALRRAGEERSERAVQRLESALDAATASGLETIAVRIRRSMRRAGLRLPPTSRDPRTNGIGLTRRERELLALVGQGMTNPEIARRMGLGRPTVARILSNAMTKLGADSRAQAVNLGADLV
jgi:DNA-binding CsgD family transcriptional regulator